MADIYFDYAAATPLDPRVLGAMQPYFEQTFYNPSALYAAARQAHDDLESWRARAAAILGARPSEIIFTAGGTESDNLAIDGVMRHYPQANIVVSAIEHDAVLEPAKQYDYRIAPVTAAGLIDLDTLQSCITGTTVLVSVMYANNEIGTVQPLAELGRLIQAIRDQRRRSGNELPLLLHSDACQAAGYLNLQVARLGVDLLTLNGGKIYGPKQSGLLYVRGGLQLTPLLRGGGQERGLRSGTENLAACAGLTTALEIAQAARHDESDRLHILQKQFVDAVADFATINGSRKHRLPNNVHLTIAGTDNERLLIQLDRAGVQAAAGSACSASNDLPSHVLQALGLDDHTAQASLRFSMGRGTTAEHIDKTVAILRELVA